MHTWLHNLPRSAQARKQNRKNRQPRPDRRSKFDALKFGLERLEDRTLLSITTETGATITPVENAAFSGPVATFTSPDNGPFTAVINWGYGAVSSVSGSSISGGPSPATFTINGSHTYTDELATNLAATITDTSDSTTATATGSVTAGEDDTLVAPAAPLTLTATEGETTSLTAAFTNTAANPSPVNDFLATIHWGDGTSSVAFPASTTPGTLTVSGSHVYAATGTHQATVTLADDAPGTASATATATVTVSAPPALAVSKSVPATAAVGDVLTETVTVINGSPAATSVAFSDALGTSGYNFVSAGDLLGTPLSYSSTTGKLTGTIGNLVASGTDIVTLRLIPTAAGTLSDTASVTASGVTATATASSTVSVGTVPANVSIKKSAPTNGTVGALLTDTITVTNAANVSTPAGTVKVFDTLGPGQSFTSFLDTLGNASLSSVPGTNTVLISLSSIPASGSDTLTLFLTPTATGTMTDTANVAVSGGNSATTTTATGSTAIAAAPGTTVIVAKSAPASAIVGSVVTETVTITNVSSSPLTNLAFSDQFPFPSPGFGGESVTLVSASDTAGSTLDLNYPEISGTIAGLAASGTPGSVDTVTVTYIPLNAGGVGDTASISLPGGNGGPSTSSSASTTFNVAPVPSPNIAIAKSAPATAPAGSLLTTTVTLTNNTVPAAAATDVAFIDDPGGPVVSASDTGGNKFAFSNGHVTGTIATLGTGASNTDTITIVTLVPPITVADTGDSAIIGVPGGNQASLFAGSTTSISPGAANVSVDKSAPATGTVGTPVTDTVTLTNRGTAAVANVSFFDLLPGNVSSVSASDAAGDKFTFANGQITGTLASVATGTTTVSVVYTPTAAGTFNDTALIGIAAGNTATSSATASTTVTPIVTIVKTGTPSTVDVGGTETYTITISNTGGTAVTGAVVTDVVPAGLTNVHASDAAGTVTVSGNTVTDNLGTVAANTGTETLTITATAAALPSGTTSTTVINTASLAFGGTTTPSNAVTTTINSVAPSTGIGFLVGQPGDGTPQTFVHNLYRELLGREPDSGGDAFWVSYVEQHNNPAGLSQVISAFMNSPEYAIHYITTLYQVILGRAPDPAGLPFWTQKMGEPGTAGGHRGSADEKFIVAAFFGTDEFYIKAGNTPQSWINAVYEDLFGRAADGQGMAFWTNELTIRGANDRDGIMRDLLSTPEAAHLVLDSFYPGVGGTSSNPLPVPGAPAGTGSTDLATITGDGWENLYLQGPYDSQPQGNDSFFNSLAGGAGWDDVQVLLLETGQFYTNPNRPITS